MSKQDFIFSNNRRHRLARHLVFWIVWCLAYNILFHYPLHVYKNWDTSGPGTKNLQDLGHFFFFIKTFFVNSLFGVIAAQIIFTYVLIYWIMPRFFFGRNNMVPGLMIAVGLLLACYAIAVCFKYAPVLYNSIAGFESAPPSLMAMGGSALADQAGSLPIVLGFALMIKLTKRWWLKQKETETLVMEKTKAELRLLKGQVRPHFLFNTLNNIYFYTLTNSSQAPIMINKLSGLLRYILYECNLPLVPIEKEVKMIRDYMHLENIRYAERLQMTINIEGNQTDKMISPLFLIPFIENSFKHGASKMISRPWLDLNLVIDDNRLRFSLINGKPSENELTNRNGTPVNKMGNIGLRNVRKRLELLYGGKYDLDIVSEPDRYSVYLSLPLSDLKDQQTLAVHSKSMDEYVVA